MDAREVAAEREVMKPCQAGHSRKFLNPNTGRCAKCSATNEARGRQKPQAKSDWKPQHQHDAEFPVALDGRVDREAFKGFLDDVLDDPIRKASFMAEGRRPGNVGRAAYGIAMRRTLREPMLNADPRRVREALERPEKSRVPKLPPFKRIVVKPVLPVARGWYERVWTIHQLRYTRGVIAVTDEGDETQIFPQYSDLRAAIGRAGWKVVKEHLDKGGNRRGNRH
jgi:hypothetical protein